MLEIWGEALHWDLTSGSEEGSSFRCTSHLPPFQRYLCLPPVKLKSQIQLFSQLWYLYVYYYWRTHNWHKVPDQYPTLLFLSLFLIHMAAAGTSVSHRQSIAAATMADSLQKKVEVKFTVQPIGVVAVTLWLESSLIIAFFWGYVPNHHWDFRGLI